MTIARVLGLGQLNVASCDQDQRNQQDTDYMRFASAQPDLAPHASQLPAGAQSENSTVYSVFFMRRMA